MRILVCGGRDFKDYNLVTEVLDKITMPNNELLPDPNLVLIHGCYDGADMLGDRWAVNNYVQIEEYPADWDQFGRAAGPIRNRQMLKEGKPDLVVAFPGGDGTADMVKISKKAEIEVREIE